MDVEQLLQRMTLRQKLAQMTQLHPYLFDESKVDELTGPNSDLKLSEDDLYLCGSLLNTFWAETRLNLQQMHMERDPNAIPMLFMQDVIHGHRTIYPIPLGMAATFNPQLLQNCAEMAAKEAAASGIDVCFSPMADLCRDARWGRIAESFGEDPYLNEQMTAATVKGYQAENRTAACVKHYAAYGAAEAGRDYNTVDMSLRTLHEYYLKGYEAAVKAGAKMVMSSFNTLNGIPAAGNRYLMNDVLRGKNAFNGCVVTDYNAVREMIAHGFAENEKECAYHAISCNNDMEMMSSTYLRFGEELVKEGRLSVAQIDECVRRILTLKQELGLFESPNRHTDAKLANELFYCKEHLDICQAAAEESCVLLKNNGVLPLQKGGKTIAVVGPFAKSKALIGTWAMAADESQTHTLLSGLQKTSPADRFTFAEGCTMQLGEEDVSGVPLALSAAEQADLIIVALGEAQWDSGEGASRTKLRLSPAQKNLLTQLKKTGKPIVGVIFAGRPLVLTDVIDDFDALLYAWHPGTMGGDAVARLLYGEVCPSGVCPVSFARDEGQFPLYYNHYTTGRPRHGDTDKNLYCSRYKDCGNTPLFPFGYGLSYTQFAVEGFTLSSDTMQKGGSITATARVKNVGTVAGKAALQWYVRDRFGSCVRPVLELKGFEKIALAPGEEKSVAFTLTEETLAFYHDDLSLFAEAGDFDLYCGLSSVDTISLPFRLV